MICISSLSEIYSLLKLLKKIKNHCLKKNKIKKLTQNTQIYCFQKPVYLILDN